MKILAFEASTRRLSVALWCDGALREKSADVPNGGAERLLPWAVELIGAAGISLAQLDGIAFGAGPGGFTGLRLACGVAQGLACGLDCPVVPVGTLAALAFASGDGKVIACLDARMNEVYVGAYEVAGEQVEEIMEVKVGAGETAPLPLASSGAAKRATADAVGLAVASMLTRRAPSRAVSTSPQATKPSPTPRQSAPSGKSAVSPALTFTSMISSTCSPATS
ncbi:MAG: tRNA (adenosine(37)-N6)-threonylcarbamoyltransferase complex dimerization subunit type 1 TsaB [Rhodocyclaceae bacterium]|nr:tRNA (adenosine(37)-N6)-threonylcarbamoyltransferase complex dimerization subunit type 1 TsaB [Rhodocyclaceae bacterium]